MIQRIQTLYLLILTALTAVTIFAPLAWFAGEMGEFRLYSFSLQSLDGSVSQSTAYMGILLVLECPHCDVALTEHLGDKLVCPTAGT